MIKTLSFLAASAVLTWAAAQNIAPDNPAGPGSAEPNLALGAGNRVYMSWLEPADSGHSLRFAVLQHGRWSRARTIVKGSNFFANWADFPSIVALGPHKLAAHWLEKMGAGRYAYGVRVAQSLDDGASWSTPVTPHRDNIPAEHGFVAMWRDRNALGLVWLDGRKFTSDEHNPGNEMQLVTTSIRANNSLASEFVVDSRTCDCCQNSAAMTAHGPIVVYRNRTSDEIRDIYIARRVNGRWLAGKPVANDNWKINACPVNGPAVSAQANRVSIAWFTAANDSPRVKVAFSQDAGATLGKPVRVDDGNPAGRVDVAMLPNGDALVSWVERTGGEASEIRARRVRASGHIGKPLTISKSTAARASGFPQMVVAGRDAIFAWTVAEKLSSIRTASIPVSEFR